MELYHGTKTKIRDNRVVYKYSSLCSNAVSVFDFGEGFYTNINISDGKSRLLVSEMKV